MTRATLEPELADVRRGDVDGVGGETPVAKPCRERLGLLAGRVARERRDGAGRDAFARLRQEAREGGFLVARVEEHVVVERLDRAWVGHGPLGRRGCFPPEPAIDAEALGQRLDPRVADGGTGSGADRERRARARRAMDDRDGNRDVEKAASVDELEAEPGRFEEPAIELAQRLVVRPVEQREREPALPSEHHGVALDQLEQRGEHGLAERRGAREAAARRVRDRWAEPRLTQVDELRRQVRRRSVREGQPFDELRGRVQGEADEGESRLSVLLVVEEREARRVGRARAESARGRDPQIVVRDEHPGVPLDRLADRRRARTRDVRVCTAPVFDRGHAERPTSRRELARAVRKRCLVGGRGRRERVRDDPDERRDRIVEPGERVLDRRERACREPDGHAAPSNHGDGTERSGVPHRGQRGALSTRSCLSRRTAPTSTA